MPISKKPIQELAIQTQEVTANGELVPAFVFYHSKSKPFVGVIMLVILLVSFLLIFLYATSFGNALIVEQILLLGGCITIGYAILRLIHRLLGPRHYLALTAKGLLVPPAQPPLFVAWPEIAEILHNEKTKSLGLVFADYQSMNSLRDFRKRIKTSEHIAGIHWNIPCGAFDAPPLMVRNTILYYYQDPEKRELIGTEAGLRELADAMQLKWHEPKQIAPIAAP